MHQLRSMTGRSHLWLRVGALALVAAAAVWPRSKPALTAREAGRTEARAETTAAKLLSAPRTAKMVVAQADESQLNN